MSAPNIYDSAVFGDFEEVERLLSRDPVSVNARDEYGLLRFIGFAGEDQVRWSST